MIYGSLLRWHLKKTSFVTVKFLIVAVLYLLLASTPLTWRSPWPPLVILVHSYYLVAAMRRYSNGGFAYLCDRGYSRDAQWGHLLLASGLAVFIVWLPAALIVWTPIRSIVQGTLFENPFFPIMAPTERIVPLVWLLGYSVLIPLCHYSWLRMGQPTSGRQAGVLLEAGLAFTGFFVLVLNYRADWFLGMVVGAAIVVAVASLFAGRALNRRLEVRA